MHHNLITKPSMLDGCNGRLQSKATIMNIDVIQHAMLVRKEKHVMIAHRAGTFNRNRLPEPDPTRNPIGYPFKPKWIA